MAHIKAFKAYRPAPGLAHKVASPPYDVVDTRQAAELAKDNPLSFLHVVRSEIDLPEGTDIHGDAVYAKAKENLERFIREGTLIPEDEECLYIYSQSMGGHIQSGIVACCAVDDYDNGIIKKHEKTRCDKEEDRTRHIITTSAQTGPVFLMYRDKTEIKALMDEACACQPLCQFIAADGVEHIVHKVTTTACRDRIIADFARVPALYIADGHHRAASSSRARAEKRKANPAHTGREEYNYVMAVIFPESCLKIMPYNRVVKDLNGLSPADFIAAVKKHFQVSALETPHTAMKGHIGLYIEGKWHLLAYKPWENKHEDTGDPTRELDCTLLQDLVLGPVLGIGDPRTDKRIDFVGGIHGPKELKRRVDSGEAAAAFLMHPVLTDEIMKVSDAGMTMPPKSTWFEPKLRSGLFIHQI